MEPSAKASDGAAPLEATPNRRSVSLKTTSIKTTPLKATSLKPASLKSVLEAATVGPSVIWMSPAGPGTSADKDPVREPARTVVAVGRATIRIVRVIPIRTNRRASRIAAEADTHSDPNRSLRIRERHCQQSKQCNISQILHGETPFSSHSAIRGCDSPSEALQLFVSSEAPIYLNSDLGEKLREDEWLISAILREINHLGGECANRRAKRSHLHHSTGWVNGLNDRGYPSPPYFS
jgi:hypothetical protein